MAFVRMPLFALFLLNNSRQEEEEHMRLKETGLTKDDIKVKVNTYMIETYERFDFVADYGRGKFIYSSDGEEYLDFYAGVAVNSLGNCPKSVVDAVKDQCADLMQVFNYPYTVPQALLAEKICTSIGMDKIFFQNSGAESNEAMIKMARKYGVEKYGEHKYNIITAKKSFHGRTMGAMTATGQKKNAIQRGFGELVPGFTYAKFNDLEDFKNAVTENTIAIMIEPVQGEGGVHPATKEFMVGLRKLCDEKGILLLLDEIQTGWCRTGEIMGFMNYGIQPDIVSMAKAMGGGMPIGAICAKEEVAKAFTQGSHGSTYGGHPVCCAASLACIEELLEKECAEIAKKRGSYFANRLMKLPYVKEVRYQGLLIGVEFEDRVNAIEIKHKCIENKLLLTAIGTNIIRMVPPLLITEADCDKAYGILKKVIEELGEEANEF